MREAILTALATMEKLVDVRLKQGQLTTNLDEGQYLMGQSRAYYQAATAIQLLLNKVEMQLVDEELAPLVIARDIVKATIGE